MCCDFLVVVIFFCSQNFSKLSGNFLAGVRLDLQDGAKALAVLRLTRDNIPVDSSEPSNYT
jgi:hypothetical protein